MQIGTLTLQNDTVFAPLAGITNLPMRLIAKEAGCGLVCSEMISSNGLVHGNDKTVDLLRSADEERPLSVQIFGSDPSLMADAAQIVASKGADIVDINMGCSVRKILKSGAGSALMRCEDLTQAILLKVRKAIDIPLSIKVRSGWDPSGDQALHIGRMAEDCGVNAIAIHPRTATQGFRGKSDWTIIKRLKEALSIPVIGNGDIECADDAMKMKSETNCDGTMIGRAAIGNPFIFRDILAKKRGRQEPSPSLDDRFEMMNQYVKASVIHLGEKTTCFMMRSRLCWFVKSLPSAKAFREKLRFVSSEAEILSLIAEYHELLLIRLKREGRHNIADGK